MSEDLLTQAQTLLDQLLVQMFSSFRYVDTRHSPLLIPGQERQSFTASDQPQSQPQPQPQSQPQQQQQETAEPAQQAFIISSANPSPDLPKLFSQRLTELAQDLVLKEQQLEVLITMLPGIGNTQQAQEARIRALNVELRHVEAERDHCKGELENLGRHMDRWIVEGVRRV